MKIINKIYEELKRSPIVMLISIFSLLIGIFGILIYPDGKEDKPVISFQIIHELDVLNLQKDVKDLTIRFKNADMVTEGLSLTSLYISIANIGDKNIKKGDFDTDIPWNLKIVDSEVIKVTSLTNDDYLEKELEKINISKGFVKLPFLMFDKKKFFVLDILVLHKKNTPIKPVMEGKISGMDKFTYVTKPFEKGSELSNFLKVAFQGGIMIQLARVLVYFEISLICIVLLVLLYDWFSIKKE